MTKILVLDFDGTITDAEAEGGPFRTGYLEDIATLAGLSIEETLSLASGFEDEVAKNPNVHGWVFQGQIVAPATVDPYLRMMPVARKILDHTHSFMDRDSRDRLLDGILYKYNYPKTKVVFRDGAHECLDSLNGTGTWIVTNSHTTPVQSKVRTLAAEHNNPNLEWLVQRVNGRAKKYILDEEFQEVPGSIHIPGLDRPVLLRRKHYFEVLKGILDENKASWSDLTVIGDIFELDPALPLALGAKVGLVVNPFTPDYERDFVDNHSRGRLIDSLAEVKDYAFSVR
jgi:hypothetical protein